MAAMENLKRTVVGVRNVCKDEEFLQLTRENNKVAHLMCAVRNLEAFAEGAAYEIVRERIKEIEEATENRVARKFENERTEETKRYNDLLARYNSMLAHKKCVEEANKNQVTREFEQLRVVDSMRYVELDTRHNDLTTSYNGLVTAYKWANYRSEERRHAIEVLNDQVKKQAHIIEQRDESISQQCSTLHALDQQIVEWQAWAYERGWRPAASLYRSRTTPATPPGLNIPVPPNFPRPFSPTIRRPQTETVKEDAPAAAKTPVDEATCVNTDAKNKDLARVVDAKDSISNTTEPAIDLISTPRFDNAAEAHAAGYVLLGSNNDTDKEEDIEDDTTSLPVLIADDSTTITDFSLATERNVDDDDDEAWTFTAGDPDEAQAQAHAEEDDDYVF